MNATHNGYHKEKNNYHLLLSNQTFGSTSPNLRKTKKIWVYNGLELKILFKCLRNKQIQTKMRGHSSSNKHWFNMIHNRTTSLRTKHGRTWKCLMIFLIQ